MNSPEQFDTQLSPSSAGAEGEANTTALESIANSISLKIPETKAKPKIQRELAKLAIYMITAFLVFGCVIKFSPLYNTVVLRPEKRNALYDQVITSKQEVSFTNPSGDILNGWYFRAPDSKKIAIVFHGNAGNVTHRLLIAKAFLTQNICVFLFDYRGYGVSTGTPTISGLVDDGEAAYKYVREKLGYNPSNIIIYGESIGTAVASRVALKNPYAGIVIQSGLTSLPDVACDGIAWLKLYPKWVFPEPQLATKTFISKLHGPILFLHGQKDKLVPVHHGHELFALASEPKQLVIIPSAGHNDMLSADEKTFNDGLEKFLKAIP